MEKHQIKRKKAFTLVELIIVITILAVLATIAFVSFQNYTKSSRDANRISTLKSIEKGLNLYNIKSNTYPEPEESVEILGTGNVILSKQGIIGNEISQKIKLNKEALDPKDKTNYVYSITGNGKKFQLGTFLEENKVISYFPQILKTYATNIDYTNRYFYTMGDKVGILFEEETNKLVTKEEYTTGTLDLTQTINQNKNFKIYFSNDTNSGSITSSGINLITTIIEEQKTTQVKQQPPSCATQPTYTNATFNTGTPTQVNQSWQSTNESEACYWTCGEGKTLLGNECVNSSCSGDDPSTKNAVSNTQDFAGGTWHYDTNPGKCTYSCNEGYHTEDNNTCILNTKQVECTQSGKPNNSTYIVSNVEVTRNGTEWNTAANCSWSCDVGYYNNNGTCETQWSGDVTNGYTFKDTSGTTLYPLNCNDLLDKTIWKNTLVGSPWNGTKFLDGVYYIKPDTNPAFKVYCDMSSSSGGWTMLSNVVSYDGTNVYISGNSCTDKTSNCGGDLKKLGNSTIDYTKVKILHQNGKYVIFNLKNGGLFENMFSGVSTYVGSIDVSYIYEDNIHSRAGFSDNIVHRGANSNNNSLWLANSSSSSSHWNTYAYKWNGNCSSIGYSNGVSSCIATGGFSIFVKKEMEIPLGSISSFPGKSCKAIKDAGYSSGDGVYWIKPDANAAFQVYCDMTTDGGGWTLVRKMQSNILVDGGTTATNTSSLTNLTTSSARLADITWNAINPTQVWNICNGYQTIYNRNMTVAWYSNHGVTDSCGYNRNFWVSMQKNFGAAAITDFTNQACGGGYSTSYSAWGIITGIHASSTTYYGCYDAQNGVNTTSAAPVKYDNRAGTAIGWGGNGYVFIR